VTVLYYLGVALLSFTRVSMWLQVALMLAPPVIISALYQDASLVKVAVLALVAALVVYTPLALLGSFIMTGGFRAAFRRLRFIYFVLVILLSVVLTFNLSQLIGII
jgi:hypothetical protein